MFRYSDAYVLLLPYGHSCLMLEMGISAVVGIFYISMTSDTATGEHIRVRVSNHTHPQTRHGNPENRPDASPAIAIEILHLKSHPARF